MPWQLRFQRNGQTTGGEPPEADRLRGPAGPLPTVDAPGQSAPVGRVLTRERYIVAKYNIQCK